MSAPEGLTRRQTDPAWIQDYFLGTGHDENTPNGTFTFVKRLGRHYAVTCGHILKALGNAELLKGARNPTVALHAGTAVMNMSSFTMEGLEPAMRSPTGETEVDIAIGCVDAFWDLLTSLKNKSAIDLDVWRAPEWSLITYCVAAGYPDEHKKRVGDQIETPLHTVVAEPASPLERAERIITLSSKLTEPHGYYFSGMSGGPMYAAVKPKGEEIQDEDLVPIGIIFEGFPSSGRYAANQSPGAAFLTGNDLFFRALTLNPQTFDEWVRRAGV